MPVPWAWCDRCGAYTPHSVEDCMDGFVWVKCRYCGTEDHISMAEVRVR